LRHGFAVDRLRTWYQQGVDVRAHLATAFRLRWPSGAGAYLLVSERDAGSRNARLTAIRSFFHVVALRDRPASVLSIASLPFRGKRTDKRLVGYLTREEIGAVLAAPDQSTWIGRRDYALLLTMYNSGARLSEMTCMRRGQVKFDCTTCLELHGKGRKERVFPLWIKTGRVLRNWFRNSNLKHGGGVSFGTWYAASPAMAWTTSYSRRLSAPLKRAQDSRGSASDNCISKYLEINGHILVPDRPHDLPREKLAGEMR